MNQDNVEVILTSIDNNEAQSINELELNRDEMGDTLTYIKKNKLAEDILLRKIENTYTMMDVSQAYLTPKGKEQLPDSE